MVTGRVAVIERLITKPVCQRVHAEGCLLNEEDSEDTRVDESTPPISPSDARDEAREDHAHEDDRLDIVAVLPDNDWIIVQVRDVSAADSLWVLLHDHPSEVGVEKTLPNGVRVLVGIGITVMSSVISRPPPNGSLNGTTTDCREEYLQRGCSGVGCVCPESVVTCESLVEGASDEGLNRLKRTRCDTKAGHEVICYRPHGCLPLKRGPVRCNEPVNGNSNDEGNIQPIDMFIPIRPSDGFFGDVWLLRVVLLVTIGFRRFGHTGWLPRSISWRSSHGCEYGEYGEFVKKEGWCKWEGGGVELIKSSLPAVCTKVLVPWSSELIPHTVGQIACWRARRRRGRRRVAQPIHLET